VLVLRSIFGSWAALEILQWLRNFSQEQTLKSEESVAKESVANMAYVMSLSSHSNESVI
jgi:hypothetical protein